jgi:hypothetical protein
MRNLDSFVFGLCCGSNIGYTEETTNNDIEVLFEVYNLQISVTV